MNSLRDVIERTNLHSVCGYLTYGTSLNELEDDGCSYEERERAAYERFVNVLNQYLPDVDHGHEVFRELAEVLSEHEAIYTEIGMIAGVRFYHEIIDRAKKME